MELVSTFFNVLNHIKLYHWNTRSYARHKSSDEFVEKITSLSDRFIETYIGKKNYTYNLTSKPIYLTIDTLNDASVIYCLEQFIDFLTNDIKKYIKDTDSELLNIRDEIMAITRQTLYLYRLN